jgi:adenylate cyclase class IV
MALIPLNPDISTEELHEAIRLECGLDVHINKTEHGFKLKRRMYSSPHIYGYIKIRKSDSVDSFVRDLQQYYEGQFEIYYKGDKVDKPEKQLSEIGYNMGPVDKDKVRKILQQLVLCSEKIPTYYEQFV